MDENESLDVLLQRLPRNEEETLHGHVIAETLDYLPLALDQAGAYIRARKLQLREFLPHYRRRKETILKEIPDQWEYRRSVDSMEPETYLSVFTTWELSFEQITGSEEEKRKKAHFLTLAAFFDNKAISERYFQALHRSSTFTQENVERDRENFESEDVGTEHAFSGSEGVQSDFGQEGIETGLLAESLDTEWMEIFSTNGTWDTCKLGDVLAEFRKLSLLQILDRQAMELTFSIHPVVCDWIRFRKSQEVQQRFAVESIAALTCYLDGVYGERTGSYIDLPWR